MRFARSLKVCRDAEDKRGEALALWRLGRSDTATGELELSAKRLSEALCALQAFEMNAEVLDCLEDFVELLQRVGEVENAVRICAAVTATREARALVRSPLRESEMQTRLKAARAALGDPAFDSAWSTGRAWTLEAAIKHALDLTTRAAVVA
jgi:hypothetical protein